MSNITSKQRLVVILANAYVVFVCAIFLSTGDMALGKFGYISTPTIMAILLLLPIAVVSTVSGFKDRGLPIRETVEANLLPISAFLLIVCASFAWALHPTAFWHDGAKYIFLDSYGFIIFVLSLFLLLHRRFRSARLIFARAALVALFLSMMTDLMLPGFFSVVPSRAAGFPGNSNYGALVLNFLCAASLTYRTATVMKKGDLFYLGLTAVGVFTTQSRSGILEFLALLSFYFIYCQAAGGWSALRLAAWIASIVVLLASIALVAVLLANNTAMFEGYRTRLDRLGGNSQIDDGSSSDRIQAAKAALEKIDDSPILGHGTGHSRFLETPPHNIYLQQWVNCGLLGLLAYLMLLIGSWWVYFKRECPAGMGLITVAIVGGFFSHNILEQRPFLMLLGMLLTESAVKARWRWAASRPPKLYVVYAQVGEDRTPSAADIRAVERGLYQPVH
ncbi:MAG: O-antigen ligase family protein [Deltaproteobacteria bacterium]|nr:O-antigen ligase family protein [Deltaproteobacteria bacterium]